MHKLAAALGGAAMTLAGICAANATTFDGSIGAPGEYFGTGNGGLNNNWTIDTGSGIEVAQKAISRFLGDIDPVAGTNIYNVPTGDTTVPGKTGANWGFVFSVNGGSQTLASIIPVLTLHDVVNNTTGGFDLRLIPDNAHALNNAVFDNDCGNAGSSCSNAETGLQNSEALSFPIIAGLLGDGAFSDAINNTFFFTLDVYANGTAGCAVGDITGAGCLGARLVTDTIQVNQGLGATGVPEPATIALFGAGLAGLGAMRRRRKVRAA